MTAFFHIQKFKSCYSRLVFGFHLNGHNSYTKRKKGITSMTKFVVDKGYGYLLLSSSLLLFGACLASEGSEELEVGTVEQALTTCEQDCQYDRFSCEMACIMDCPDQYCQGECVAECDEAYNTCMYDDYRRSALGNQNGAGVCHLDLDNHIFSVDVEFYTADSYNNVSCSGSGPTKYKKRYLGKVSCSAWTGLVHPSVCKARVDNKIAQLAGQGYLPNFPDADIDNCPTPRL